jgi:hypothetical protein
MRTWLANGLAAFRLAADRADLWLAGGLGWLVYLGWLPLLLTVVPLPDAGDLAYLGASLVLAGAFPANVVALAVAVVGAAWLLMLLAAAAEVAILDGTARLPLSRGAGPAALSALAIVMLASLPTLGAIGALITGMTAVAPGEFQSSQLEVSVLVRILAALWPFVAAFAVLVVAGQAFGALAIRRATLGAAPPLARALGIAGRDLGRHPVRRAATAVLWLLIDAALFVLVLALLRVLWAPIGADLVAGQLLGPSTLLLLVGFMAIWLVLLLATGAVQVARSAWWSLEAGVMDPGGVPGLGATAAAETEEDAWGART